MPFTHNAICKVLEKKLSSISTRKPRSSKELNFKIEIDGKYVGRVTVSKGRKEIKKGTEGGIRGQFKLPKEEFKKLIECPMSKQQYIDYLKANDKV